MNNNNKQLENSTFLARMAPSSLIPLLLSSLPLLLALSQHAFLSQMKQSLSGPLMSSRWRLPAAPGNDTSYCGFRGLTCDAAGRVVAIDVSSWSLAGSLPPDVCSAVPALRSLRLGGNGLRGGFPTSILNCSSLEELNLSSVGLSGTVPDLSPLRSLRALDLSGNFFAGVFPASVFNLTSLRYINFNQNPGFDTWPLPPSAAALTSLKVLILSTTSVRGEVPPWLGNMTSLVDLELSGNLLTGGVPPSLGRLRNLQVLELYYNLLAGEIPEALGNLTRLVDTDLSVNRLTGPIPERLFRLPRLRVLQLYSNGLTGRIPAALGNSTTLTMLSVYRNLLSGPVPDTLGRFSPLVVLELSENGFTGELPPDVCAGGKLLYILVLGNRFTGRLPETYADCTTLLRLRANGNRLSGAVPGGIFGLPRASIIDLGSNRLEGGIAGSIGDAKNLSALLLQNNRISGALPPEISRATSLVKIDISNNLLSGPIPSEIGNLNMLNQLSLQGNRLDSSIPGSLSCLKSLNVLNLSGNLLTGEIPESLCELLPNSLDFSNNRLSGPVPLPLIESAAGNPALCAPVRLNRTGPILPPCRQAYLKRRLDSVWVIGVSAVLLAVFGALLFATRRLRRNDEAIDRGRSLGLSFSPPFDVTSFHRLSFEQHEIAEAMTDKNIVGHGGSGTVYKVELAGGEVVAVKRLWSGRKPKDRSPRLDGELRAEVETLGSVRHKNIVKLYCCFTGRHSSLLVYEYMPNGSLWDALHGAAGGRGLLDWPTRRRIAVGVARGLAYLHHGLFFPIVHRDIKTSNILLDAEFEPKVADFGIAKVLQTAAGAGPGEDGASTDVIAGTCGYLAPEYAYSAKASTKCDVYSYGVVLMELITGKKPNEPEFGENRSIIHWVNSKMASGEEGEGEGGGGVVDRRLSRSPFRAEMARGLRVAVRCTCSAPSLRPTMSEVVQVLAKPDPRASLGLGGAQSFQLRESPPIRAAKVLNMDLTM